MEGAQEKITPGWQEQYCITSCSQTYKCARLRVSQSELTEKQEWCCTGCSYPGLETESRGSASNHTEEGVCQV